MVVQIPAPFPYKDNKQVPWNYNYNIITPGEPEVTIADVSGVGHFTRSGRCYSHDKTEPIVEKVKDLKLKGKEPLVELDVEVVAPKRKEIKEPVGEEEAEEFLKFLKHSEYSVVEQLHKQPAKISILSLLMNSETHQNALLKVLNQTYVANNISVDKLDRLVNNLNADNFISFSDDEIPPGGRGTVKALQITTCCKGYILPSVLVDNGSALNVMPLSTLSRLPVDLSHVRTCNTVVKAFDGTTRNVVGKIEVPLQVGPNVYEVEFLVMDIMPSYNCLLGRPWIHSAGAVPSSLHQKVKFVMNGRLVTINAEEDIIATTSTEAPYVSIDEDAFQCSYRSLECVNATFILEGNKIPTPKWSKATHMNLKMTIGKGAQVGKGLGSKLQGMLWPLRAVLKMDRYGLGFKPNERQREEQSRKNRERREARLLGQEAKWGPLFFPHISETFLSKGFIHAGREERAENVKLLEKVCEGPSINTIGQGANEHRDLSMIHPCPPGYALSNWTAIDIPAVFKEQFE